MGRAKAKLARDRAGQSAQAMEPGARRQVLSAFGHPGDAELQRSDQCRKSQPVFAERHYLCSYQFAGSKEPYVRQVAWDLVVIDEAHRLRNVYKTSSHIALAIKQAVSSFPKVLLTATPLQNSLLELYGLVSIIDEYAFGDLKSFRARFARLGNQADFTELKERLKPICKRTLRRQVLEYVPYTDRHALVQEFVPSPMSNSSTILSRIIFSGRRSTRCPPASAS